MVVVVLVFRCGPFRGHGKYFSSDNYLWVVVGFYVEMRQERLEKVKNEFQFLVEEKTKLEEVRSYQLTPSVSWRLP